MKKPQNKSPRKPALKNGTATIELTDQHWYRMVDNHMGRPVPLHRADLTRSFIYDRTWGVFYCGGGSHPTALALLLAFHMGSLEPVDTAEELGVEYSAGAADYLLKNYPGTCYHSTVDAKIIAGRRGSLNPMELRLLAYYDYEVRYLEEDD